MKLAIALIALLLCVALPGTTQDNPRTHSKVYSLLPAETLNLANKEYRDVEIRSEYPVQFLAGPDCHNDYTVQWHCRMNEPNDLFIRDLRTRPVFTTPKANAITVTVTEN
jgi:hypothetical protein